jgi:hypothetical protein
MLVNRRIALMKTLMSAQAAMLQSAKPPIRSRRMANSDPQPKNHDDRELATAGMIAKLYGVTRHWIQQLAREERLPRRAWQRVGAARWPLYDVQEAGEILGRTEVDQEKDLT